MLTPEQNDLVCRSGPGTPLPFRCAERQAMRDMLNTIVVASMITSDKNRYKELFQERQQPARTQAIV